MQITGFSARIVREQDYLVERYERSTAALERVAELAQNIERRRIVKAAGELRDLAEAYRVQVERVQPTARTLVSASAAGSPLAFDTSTLAATLSSTAEINTDAVAFLPRAPLWSGTSTSQAGITGPYDGSLGTTTLTATVINAGERGVSNARVEVADDNSPWSARLNVNRNHPLNQTYSTNIGLDFTFGLGTFDLGDTFTIELQVGADVKPDAAGTFDASQGTDANLESGQSVVAGSFTVNGALIAVNADDSIDDVIARINASAAGVTASYDAAGETIDFVQNTPGAAPTINLASDTSGFLAAMKLDAAVVTPGKDSDLDRPIDQVGVLGGISSGAFVINGVHINVDTASDSVNDLLTAINASGAGVTAELEGQSVLTIASNANSGFTLDSNGTGFFEAFGITPGTFEGGPAGSSVPRPPEPSLYKLSRGANDLVKGINKLLDSPAFAGNSDLLESLQSQIGQLLQDELVEPLSGLNLRTGVKYDASGTRADAVSQFNQAELRRGFRWQFNQVRGVFSDARPLGQEGFLKKLVQLLDETVLAPQQPGALLDVIV